MLCAPPWVLEILRNGYVLPFYSHLSYVRPNHHSAQVELEFFTNAVAELLKSGYTEEVREPPIVRSPLSVVTNDVGNKKNQLAVNVRHVNQSLWKQKFSMKTCVW